MIVAAHHLKGTPQHEFHERLKKYMGEGGTPEFWPQKPWPEKCFVQWGIGIVPAGVSFFEAFPGNDDTAGGFIRGEGSTLEEAEASAFAKYERQHECQHLWGREDYKNGYALCRRCRAGRSGLAISLVHHAEQFSFRRIERVTRQAIAVEVVAGHEPTRRTPSTTPRPAGKPAWKAGEKRAPAAGQADGRFPKPAAARRDGAPRTRHEGSAKSGPVRAGGRRPGYEGH